MEAALTYQSILSELGPHHDLSNGGNAPVRRVELFDKGRGAYEADTLYVALAEDVSSSDTRERLSFLCCDEPKAGPKLLHNVAYVPGFQTRLSWQTPYTSSLSACPHGSAACSNLLFCSKVCRRC